jgi:hypothetical protein
MFMEVKHPSTVGTLQIARVAALGVVLMVGLPPEARADAVTPPSVPANIQVSAEYDAVLVGHAVGTQNYVCLPAASIGRVAWTLFTPQATLFDDQHEQLLTHFFSPNPDEGGIVRATWQDSRDTSTVWGRVTASSSDPAFVAAGAIPWLLIQVVGDQAGPTGGEAVSATAFIQRVNTVGGTAPSTGCARPTDIGKRVFVPYTADYYFFE